MIELILILWISIVCVLLYFRVTMDPAWKALKKKK